MSQYKRLELKNFPFSLWESGLQEKTVMPRLSRHDGFLLGRRNTCGVTKETASQLAF